MDQFGEVLGWVAAVCYFVSVANFFVKRIFQARVTGLPKESAFRKGYQFFMKLIVRYHRYFGMAAGAFALFYLCWQIVNVRVSYSGVLVAAIMAVTAVLGGVHRLSEEEQPDPDSPPHGAGRSGCHSVPHDHQTMTAPLFAVLPVSQGGCGRGAARLSFSPSRPHAQPEWPQRTCSSTKNEQQALCGFCSRRVPAVFFCRRGMPFPRREIPDALFLRRETFPEGSAVVFPFIPPGCLSRAPPECRAQGRAAPVRRWPLCRSGCRKPR